MYYGVKKGPESYIFTNKQAAINWIGLLSRKDEREGEIRFTKGKILSIQNVDLSGTAYELVTNLKCTKIIFNNDTENSFFVWSHTPLFWMSEKKVPDAIKEYVSS